MTKAPETSNAIMASIVGEKVLPVCIVTMAFIVWISAREIKVVITVFIVWLKAKAISVAHTTKTLLSGGSNISTSRFKSLV
jgi:hypothetical protein